MVRTRILRLIKEVGPVRGWRPDNIFFFYFNREQTERDQNPEEQYRSSQI